MSKSDKKKIRSNFYRKKDTVGFMLRYIPHFPPVKPVGNVDQYRDWLKSLSELSEAAQDAVTKALQMKRATLSELTCHDTFTASKNPTFKPELPQDTPQDYRELFSSNAVPGQKRKADDL